MAYRKLTMMPKNGDHDSCDPTDVDNIELLKRAKNVLTSTKLKKEYDSRRNSKMRIAISEQSGCTTSFTEWLNSCSDNSQKLSDSDLSSSSYTSSETGGKASESVRLIYSGSEGEDSERSDSECTISDKINHDNQLEILSTLLKKTENKETKSKFKFVKNDINDSVFKEPQSNSHSTQDHQTKRLSKKRDLSLSNSLCGEKASELKSPQKPSRKKRKKKKKKKGSMIKRFFQNLGESRT